MKRVFFVAAIACAAELAACASPSPGETGGNGGGGASTSSPSSSSGGGGVGGMICDPGSKIPCYTGPSGTLGVGICKGGEQTCNAQGTGYGLCEGEVTPGTEDCATPEDDDCDGTALDVDAGCVCLPNAVSPCYSGPAGTEGVGICKAGMATCSADGKSLGACAGEVVPKAEDCMTPEDEDCDGSAPPCGGEELWAKRFGDATSQVAKGLAVRPDGTSFTTGYMYGTADFGTGPITSAGQNDVFLAKLDTNGNGVWAKRFGDAGSQEGRAVAVDANGNVAFTGFFSGSIDLGGGALIGAGSNDVFVAKLDGSGNHLWSKGFGNNSNQYGNAIAFSPTGEVVLAGHFGGTVDFGGGVLTAGAADAYVVKFSANGAHVWSKSFGDASNQYAYGVAVSAAGNVVLAGAFGGQIDFGAGQLSTAGLSDIFLASFDANGNLGWAKRFGDGADQFGYAVAVDPASGKIALAGAFGGTVNFGGSMMTTTGNKDAFVAVFTSAGAHVWSKQFGDIMDDAFQGVAFDTSGNVIAVGSTTGANGSDVLIAKLDPAGTLLWKSELGDASDQGALAVAADGMDHVFVAGSFTGSLDFGLGALVSAGTEDAFLAKLKP